MRQLVLVLIMGFLIVDESAWLISSWQMLKK